jgi:hypothetical protein
MATVKVEGGPADGSRIEVDGKPDSIEVYLRTPRFAAVDDDRLGMGQHYEPCAPAAACYAGLYRRDGKRGVYVWDGVLRLVL